MIPTRVLIKLVRERGCLWDRAHPLYRDASAKRRAWYHVFRELEPTYETLRPARKKIIRHLITKKWYNARDSYVKFLRLGTHTRPYVHSDELKFLDAMYLRNSDQQNLKRLEQGDEDLVSAQIEATDDQRDTESEALDAENTEIASDSLEVERPRHKVKDAREINIVSVLASLLDKEEDEDRAFFRSITPAVNALAASSKLEFRVQVLKLINSLKVKDQAITLKVERVSDLETETE